MKSFFAPQQSEPSEHKLSLGNFSMPVPLSKLHDKSGFFLYFVLNDHPELIKEAARLVAAQIKALGLANPYFVTPAASTDALAFVLRDQYKIPGTIIYKEKKAMDINPVSVAYVSGTSKSKKQLFLGQSKAKEMQGQDIIILDSVVETGETIRATYQVLIKAGISPDQIKQASVLFTEGKDRTEINVADGRSLELHRFANLPIIEMQNTNIKVGVVGSQSNIKLSVVRATFKEIMPEIDWDREIQGVAAKSDKPEQPEGTETIEGAINRANDAFELDADCDFVISIESGIFKRKDGSYYDMAVIYGQTRDKKKSFSRYSEKLEVPTEWVEEARRRGFAKCTFAMVGKEILNAQGIELDDKDPHVYLDPQHRTRAQFLHDPVLRICEAIYENFNSAPQLSVAARAKM